VQLMPIHLDTSVVLPSLQTTVVVCRAFGVGSTTQRSTSACYGRSRIPSSCRS